MIVMKIESSELIETLVGTTVAGTLPLVSLIKLLIKSGVIKKEEVLESFTNDLNASAYSGQTGALLEPVWKNLLKRIES
jgi:hypothetical protein